MSSATTFKRRRVEEEDDEDAKLKALLEASEEYTPYVPLKQRLKGGGGNGHAAREEEKGGHRRAGADHDDGGGNDTDDEDAEEAAAAAEEEEERRRQRQKQLDKELADAKKSLLDVTEEMKKRREHMDPTLVKLEIQKQQEARILGEVRGCVSMRGMEVDRGLVTRVGRRPPGR